MREGKRERNKNKRVMVRSQRSKNKRVVIDESEKKKHDDR